MKKLLLAILTLALYPAWGHAQSINVSVPIHTVNKFDRSLPMQDWKCSAAQAELGTHMLNFLDTDGSVNGYVDCHGNIHGGGGGPGLTAVGMLGDGTVYQTTVTNSPVTQANQPGPLTPQLQLQPPATFLAGPVLAVPGASSVLQSNAGFQDQNPANVTAVSIPFNGASQPGNAIIFSFNCINRGNTWTTATVTDSNGDTFALAAANGQAGQWISTNIAGGPTTVNATFTYGGGIVCNQATYSILEATNLTGVVDASNANGLFFATGTFPLSITSTFSNDLLVTSATANSANVPEYLAGPVTVAEDQTTGISTFGWGVYGHSATALTGTYTINVFTNAIQGYGFLVAYQTGGTFNPKAIWVDRALQVSDLPAAAQAALTAPQIKDISIGEQGGAALVDTQLGPQERLVQIPANATIIEVDVDADDGTPNVIVGVNHNGSVTNVLSSALSTAASGGVACANVTGTLSENGTTICSSTLENIIMQRGDYLQLVSGTAGGTATLFNIHVWYALNSL